MNRKLYEGMFLIDSAQTADWDGITTTIKNILKKADAEIVDMKKWDDRRLAYEIGGKIRGTYILCYFKADGEKIQDVEKAVQLSERIMRVLILSTEQMTAEDMAKATPAEKAKNEAASSEEAKAARVAEPAPVDADESAPEAETAESDGEAPEGGESDMAEDAEEPYGAEAGSMDEASLEAESEGAKESDPR
ncbi:MAG: 30S ribosomal protein S6 [Sedimentisphaerales bacterium]|nr:30S ribosomal protein S6 [Sedimentisphaerales bacterium]